MPNSARRLRNRKALKPPARYRDGAGKNSSTQSKSRSAAMPATPKIPRFFDATLIGADSPHINGISSSDFSVRQFCKAIAQFVPESPGLMSLSPAALQWLTKLNVGESGSATSDQEQGSLEMAAFLTMATTPRTTDLPRATGVGQRIRANSCSQVLNFNHAVGNALDDESSRNSDSDFLPYPSDDERELHDGAYKQFVVNGSDSGVSDDESLCSGFNLR